MFDFWFGILDLGPGLLALCFWIWGLGFGV